MLSPSLLQILPGADFGLYFCVMCPQKLLMAAMLRIFGHRGLDNQLLAGEVPPASADVRVRRRERIGGLLNYYHREAA